MISNIVLILLIIFSIISYYAFVLPKKERVLFRMYAERDNLTIYIMNNPGKQDEEAYQYLIGVINAEIYLIKNNLSLTDYFRTTIEKTVENEKEVEHIIELIREDEFMGEVFENTFHIFLKYFSSKFRWFYRIFLCPAAWILKCIYYLINILKRGNLSDREKKINNVFSNTLNMPKIYEKYIRLNKA